MERDGISNSKISLMFLNENIPTFTLKIKLLGERGALEILSACNFLTKFTSYLKRENYD